MTEERNDGVADEPNSQMSYEEKQKVATAYAKNYVRGFIGAGLVFLLVVAFGVRTFMRNAAVQSAIKDQQWQKVLELDEDNIEGLLGRAKLRSNSGDFDGALEDLNRAEELSAPADDLKQAKAYYFMQQATSHAEAVEIDESLADFKAAQDLGASGGMIAPYKLVLADAYVKRCEKQLENSKFAEAMADLDRAKENNEKLRIPSSVAFAVTGASVKAFEASPTVENRDTALKSINMFRLRHVDSNYYREPGPAGDAQAKQREELREKTNNVENELIGLLIAASKDDIQILELKKETEYAAKRENYNALLTRIAAGLQTVYDKSLESDDKERALAVYGQMLRTDPKRAAAAKPKLPKLPSIQNSLGMDMLFVSPGLCNMGKFHVDIVVARPFRMSAREVTQATYEKVMGANPSVNKSPQNPVDSVSWEDAVEFCRRLSEMPEEKKHGRVYRLPKETEWEFCCRAGIHWRQEQSRKADPTKSDWFKVNSDNKSQNTGQKQANEWGFFDLRGNVSEWCSSWYWPSLRIATTRDDAPGEKKRVIRGGNYTMNAAVSGPERRAGLAPVTKQPYLGFRIATFTLK